MSETFANDNRTMGKNVALILTVVSLMMCLNFNYTFPLHKNSTVASVDNHSQLGDYAKIERIDSIVDKSKKMAANLEHALRKFIESTPKKAVDRCSHGKHGEVDNDFNNYEQLVIMKKYPFLDLQELNFNVRQLASKNSGQNLNSEQVLIAQDPSFCESSNEGPSVEITNRGLSGFALPAKLPKPETKEKPADVRYERTSAKSLSDYLNLIKSLEDDIKSFEVHHIR